MKKLIFALMFLSIPAFAANPLVKFVRGNGFIEHGGTGRTVQILDNGDVTMEIISRQSAKPSISIIATLAPATLAKVESAIAAIPADAKLIDPQAGAPVCEDARRLD